MEIRGLIFAGTATDRRAAMAEFSERILGMRRTSHGGDGADMFELPDGTRFAVADEREDHPGTSRTIGFLVDDVLGARHELTELGVQVGQPSENERHRYVHFVAPDGELYELVEELRPDASTLTP